MEKESELKCKKFYKKDDKSAEELCCEFVNNDPYVQVIQINNLYDPYKRAVTILWYKYSKI